MYISGGAAMIPQGAQYLQQFAQLLQAFEAEGRQALGVHLTRELASGLGQELRLLYGDADEAEPGAVFGVEVLSLNAVQVRFID